MLFFDTCTSPDLASAGDRQTTSDHVRTFFKITTCINQSSANLSLSLLPSPPVSIRCRKRTQGYNMEPIIAGAACLAALAILTLVRPLLARTSIPTSIQQNLQQTLQHPHHSKLPIHIEKLSPHLIPAHGNKRRLIIVGDVHGCVDECKLHTPLIPSFTSTNNPTNSSVSFVETVKTLLHRISFTPSHDHLILAGDLINKGPDSHGVLALVRSLSASCVRGNHEDKILRARAALFPTTSETTTLLPKSSSSSPSSGSGEGKMADTLARELTEKDIEYIRRWPTLLDLGALEELGYARAAVVHAGLVPGVDLIEQEPFHVMNMRAIEVCKSKKKGVHIEYKPSEDRDNGRRWWSVWNEFQSKQPKGHRMLCVYGHDSKQGLVEKEYSVGLDSGCVKGERLSALIVEEKGMRVESVKSKRDYTAKNKK